MSLAQPKISEAAARLGGVIIGKLRALTYDERVAIIAQAMDEVCTAELMSHGAGLEAIAERLRGINVGKELRGMADELTQTGTISRKAVRS